MVASLLRRRLVGRGLLYWREGGAGRLTNRRLTTCRLTTWTDGLRTTLQRAQAFLKQLVLVLQLFVLAGELPQLVLEVIDLHLRIAVIRLRKRLRSKREHRGGCHGTRNSMEFG